MRKIICVLLAVSIVMSFAIPSFAHESEETWYGAINVEYSDALGSLEKLDVMVNDAHVYVDANVLSERLGYECVQEGNRISIYAKNFFFNQDTPLLAVHYSINSTEVSYNPLFGAEYKYTAPAPCVQNDNGIWVPLAYTLVLLGGNSTVLEDMLIVQMPRNNVLSLAAIIANNEQLLSFDWVDDFGYSETTTNITNGAGRIVTLFSGLIEFDGDAWLSLIDWSAFDKKFGKSLAMMFCTNSAEELQESIKQVEILLDVFDPEGKVGEMLQSKQLRINSDATAWKTVCEEYLKLLEEGSGSPAKYNLLYQQYERAVDDQSLFAVLGGENALYIQNELSSAANVLDVASKIGSAVSYLSEFQQKDDYQISVLENYLNTRSQTGKMPEATAEAMLKYISSTDGAGQYVFSRFLEEHALELIVEKSGLDAYLGAPANILLLAWDIMSETIPFYSDGLEAVENREISNYAQKIQNDALKNVNKLLSKLKNGTSKLSAEDCVQLSEYCYVYLKACYIARSSAIKSLEYSSEEFQNQIKGKLDVEADINRIIIQYLSILSSADTQNMCYVLGFLPENNNEYLRGYSDDALLSEIMVDGVNSDVSLYNDILTMYHNSISCNWTNCDGEGWDDVGDPDNASYLFWHFEKDRSLAEVGYALLDINNDGKPELFVSLLDIAESGSFYDMYTIIDGELIHVVSAGERDRYNLAEDYSINNYGSGGAALSSNDNYRLDNASGTLKINQAVIYDGWRDSENPWFYATTDYYDEETYEFDYDVLKPISSDEASALRNSFPENASLELIPFSDFEFVSLSNLVTDSYSEMLSQGTYVQYVQENAYNFDFTVENGQMVYNFALVDVNQDGRQELIIDAMDMLGWFADLVFTQDADGSVIFLGSLWTYSSVEYSAKHSALSYIIERPAFGEVPYAYIKISETGIIDYSIEEYDDSFEQLDWMTMDEMLSYLMSAE